MNRVIALLLILGSSLWMGTARAADPVSTDPAAAVQAVPAVQVVEKEFTFPKPVEEENVSHVYKLKNSGSSVLEIKSVYSD